MQWLVVLVPGLLVVGDLVAMAWGLEPVGRIAFLQRLLVLIGFVQMAQVLFGHRMPGLAGPSSVLLVGIISTVGSGPASVYGAMAIGGGVMALLGFTGLAARLGKLYTPPVLASTLMLIAINLAPAMQGMIFDKAAAGQSWGAPFLFAMALSGLILWSQIRLKGLLGSSMIVLGMVAGSIIYYLIGMGPFPGWNGTAAVGFSILPEHGLTFDPPVLAAFLICYLALISNELGTLESLGHMLELPDLEKRVNRSVSVGGLGCVAAAFGGTLGPVTYAVSPGVVLATHNASRWTLLPAAMVTVLLGLWPTGMEVFQLVPPPVSGSIVFCLMSYTAFAALSVLETGKEGLNRRSGLVLGAATICGVIITFMSPEAKQALHPYLRPILGNGFVAGLLLAMILEHTLPRLKLGT